MKKHRISFKILLAIAAMIFSLRIANAQTPGTDQIGIRLGGFSGFTYRHIDNKNIGIEASLLGNVPHDCTLASLLIEKHFPLDGNGFVFYAGGGGYFSYNYDFNFGHHDVAIHSHAGVEAVVGLDYYLPIAPMSVGIDFRPRFVYLVYPYPWDAGLNVRLVF